jgi:hypothetical protein
VSIKNVELRAERQLERCFFTAPVDILFYFMNVVVPDEGPSLV